MEIIEGIRWLTISLTSAVDYSIYVLRHGNQVLFEERLKNALKKGGWVSDYL